MGRTAAKIPLIIFILSLCIFFGFIFNIRWLYQPSPRLIAVKFPAVLLCMAVAGELYGISKLLRGEISHRTVRIILATSTVVALGAVLYLFINRIPWFHEVLLFFPNEPYYAPWSGLPSIPPPSVLFFFLYMSALGFMSILSPDRFIKIARPSGKTIIVLSLIACIGNLVVVPTLFFAFKFGGGGVSFYSAVLSGLMGYFLTTIKKTP